MGRLSRMVILAPFGVYPPRSGGHSAVLEPARRLARAGVEVHLFGLGVRRFEAFRHFRSFVRELEPGLVEERLVSPWNWLDFLRRGRSGLPPLTAGKHLIRRASKLLREKCGRSDLIQYESPWLFPFRVPGKPTVLVAHNAEADLLAATVASPPADRLARAVELECNAWRGATAVLCLTEEDRGSLADAYGDREASVVPLGVDVQGLAPPSTEERASAREDLGVKDRHVVLFTGAWHLPNRSAMEQMRVWAGPAPEDRLYVAAGTVSPRRALEPRFLATGPVADLGSWFAAADCAVNPVVTGGGANVKLLEYLARGLPVVSTPFGARGLDVRHGEHLWIAKLSGFPEAIERLRSDPDLAGRLGAAGRRLVVAERSWEAITRTRTAIYEDYLARGDQG